eukprot:765990-Hanusia_phi.AAC.8
MPRSLPAAPPPSDPEETPEAGLQFPGPAGPTLQNLLGRLKTNQMGSQWSRHGRGSETPDPLRP